MNRSLAALFCAALVLTLPSFSVAQEYDAFPSDIADFRLGYESTIQGPPVLPTATQPAVASRIVGVKYYEYTIPPETVETWTRLVTVKQFQFATDMATDADAQSVFELLGFSLAAYSEGVGITTRVTDKFTYPAETLAGAQSNIYVVIVHFIDEASGEAETNIMRFYVKSGRVYQDVYAERSSVDSNPAYTFAYDTFAATRFPDPAPVASATTAQTGTTSPLQEQIDALLAEVALLQAKLGGYPQTSNQGSVSYTVGQPYYTDSYTSQQRGSLYSCLTLSHDLRRGTQGSDVAALQKYLSLNEGVYPEARVTGYYGALTEAAVQRWQAKNAVVSHGSAGSTGYGVVGPRTRAAMANCNRAVLDPCATLPASAVPSREMCLRGTWTPTYDANFCHVGWQCANERSCPTRRVPSCDSERVVSRGLDEDGCHLGYRCSDDSTSKICGGQVDDAEEYAADKICASLFKQLRCSYRSSYTYDARNECEAKYLEQMGWEE